ncbi:hypothetical protein GCM10009827_037370 [Dactylosporangium maewongense]|uniref:Uncharacterized protein n=1 Tax=Dactylosporangium maewongense TaxID=634393 RepID=A0ABN2AHE0_9ACTN
MAGVSAQLRHLTVEQLVERLRPYAEKRADLLVPPTLWWHDDEIPLSQLEPMLVCVREDGNVLQGKRPERECWHRHHANSLRACAHMMGACLR